jgi:hypothetical protein
VSQGIMFLHASVASLPSGLQPVQGYLPLGAVAVVKVVNSAGGAELESISV